MAVNDQDNEITVTLPADVMRELRRAFEASRAALAAVIAAHDGDETVLAQKRRVLAASERELAQVTPRPSGDSGRSARP